MVSASSSGHTLVYIGLVWARRQASKTRALGRVKKAGARECGRANANAGSATNRHDTLSEGRMRVRRSATCLYADAENIADRRTRVANATPLRGDGKKNRSVRNEKHARDFLIVRVQSVQAERSRIANRERGRERGGGRGSGGAERGAD